MRKFILITSVPIIFLITSVPIISFAIEKKSFYSAQSNREAQVVRGEILVKFKSGVSQSKKMSILSDSNAYKKDEISKLKIERIKLPVGMSVQEAVEYYRNLPEVEFAEPNYIRKAFATPNDTSYNQQWGLSKIYAEDAWDKVTVSSAIIVAVIDSGVWLSHLDLLLNLTTGYDFVNNDNNPNDDYGHGTHVAGIIAAATNNSAGIAGVAGGWGTTPGVRIMPVKALDLNGDGGDFDISAGIIYAADNGAKIINMSFGGDGYSNVLSTSCSYAYDKGCIMVAASGNDGKEGVAYPAAFNNIIAVGASDQSDKKASFSNYGNNLTSVTLVAPGVGILSTLPNANPGPDPDAMWDSTGYGNSNGTSMATPFVSGVVALLLSQNSNLSFEEVFKTLTKTADDIESPGWDKYTGYGRLNALASLGFSIKVPEEKPSNAPNPFYPNSLVQTKKTTKIYLPQTLRGPSPTLRVYNIAGELVRTVQSNSSSRVEWDGKNDQGDTVANGIYLYVVQTDKGIGQGKVTLIKE